MAYLKDLSVSKISFVNKAANRRKFLLLKSMDFNIDNGVYIPMRQEVKSKLSEVFKSVTAEQLQSTVQIVDLVKADESLKLTESEIAEVSDHVDVMKDIVLKMTAEEKKKLLDKDKEMDEKGIPHKDKINDHDEDNVKKMADETAANLEKKELLLKIDTLTATLEKLTKDSQRRDIVSWLQKECAFLPEDIQKTADEIMLLDAANPTLAASYRDKLRKMSTTVEKSSIFSENGVTTDVLLKAESDGFNLIQKFNNDLQTLQKSADPSKAVTSDAIVALVKKHGREYDDYRVAHILRAKRDAI